MQRRIDPISSFNGTVEIPGDKSISHRALIFGAMAEGRTRLFNLPQSGDVSSTIRCLKNLGVTVSVSDQEVTVRGRGKKGFKDPQKVLDCGNSGTTMRLLMGLLAGQSFYSNLTGDISLVKRPMKRVAQPLEKMGAKIILAENNHAPVHITGSPLEGFSHHLVTASAQIKTALLIAGLCAHGKTQITGEIASRDHTERLLPYFGAHLDTSPTEIAVQGTETLNAVEFNIPGDPSSAAFWMGAAALIKGGDIQMQNISLNPTRTGFLKVLKKMGALIESEITQDIPEPVGNLRIRHAPLKAISIAADEIPFLIDEIPLLAILATQAEGETVIRGAKELRVKESDRIEAIASNLKAMGADVTTFEDGLSITGPQPLRGAPLESFHDHRIAMAFTIAALAAKGPSEIKDAECVEISYPQFYDALEELI